MGRQHGQGAVLKPCLHHSGPKRHKDEKFLGIPSWRWHGGCGCGFHWNKIKRWNLWLDLSSFYITSYSCMRSHHLLWVVAQVIQPCFLPYVYVAFLIHWKGEELLDSLGDGIWSGISDPQKGMRKETPEPKCSAGKSDWLDSNEKISFKLFHFSFATHWEVLISLWKLFGLTYLLESALAFDWTLTVCTSTTCAGKWDVSSGTGTWASGGNCPSHLKILPLDVTHELFSYLRDLNK